MSKASIIRDVLLAIDDGRLSMEEVLPHALGTSQRLFSQWLVKRLSTAPRRPERVQVWRVRDVDSAVADAAVGSVRRRYGRFAGVTSIHWGARRKRGRLCAENCVVVHCTTKWPSKSLPKKRRLPKSVRVHLGGRRYTVPVDVRAVGVAVTAQSISTAAAGKNRAVWMDAPVGQQTGALGAVVTDGQGASRAVLSAHVAEQKDRRVFVGSTEANAIEVGTVAAVVRDDSDVAWTTPLTDPDQVMTLRTSDPRDPTNNDVRTAVTVLVARDFRGARSFIDEVGVSANVQFPDGSVAVISGLTTLSPAVTLPGDSGAPVVDFNDALIGFVVGAAADKTFILPARRALNDLET